MPKLALALGTALALLLPAAPSFAAQLHTCTLETTSGTVIGSKQVSAQVASQINGKTYTYDGVTYIFVCS